MPRLSLHGQIFKGKGSEEGPRLALIFILEYFPAFRFMMNAASQRRPKHGIFSQTSPGAVERSLGRNPLLPPGGFRGGDPRSELW